MRTALLIGLVIAATTSSAQAQVGQYTPYQAAKTDRDPYDLPKAYYANPYDRDYSTNRDSSAYTNTRRDRRDDGYSPGGYSAGGSSNRRSPSGGYLGYRIPSPPAYGSRGRDTSHCKIGLVC